MEVRNATTLKSAGKDSTLIETVKSNKTTPAERNNESGCGEKIFLISMVQGGRYSEAVFEAASQKLPKEEVLVWTDLCRICANTNDRFIPIFEGEGAEYDLSNKILKYLPIHVSKSDTLPLQLCYQCAAMLLGWHHLSEECLNAEKRLLELQNTLQNKHQYYNVTSLGNLGVPTTVNETTTTIVSNVATSQLDLQVEEEIEKKHETHSADEINKSYRCSAASEKSSAEYRSSHNAVLLRASNVTTKYENATAVRLTPTAENAKEISERESWDSDGTMEFEEQRDLNSSRCKKLKSGKALFSTGESTTDYPCDNCKRTFGRKCHLMRHKKYCKNCDSINKEDTSMMRVKATENKLIDDKSVERNNPVQPQKSDAKNTSDDKNQCQDVRSEKSSNKRSGTHPCNYCEYIATKRKLLNVHLKEAHPELLRRRISVIDSETVLRARIEHDGKVYYRCSECGRNMKSPYTFYWHTRIHTGERLLTCYLCDKRFRLNQTLARHLREIHAGLTKVLCDLCGRMFNTQRSAIEHRRIHTNERPYTCSTCDKTFRTTSGLNIHVRQVHNSVKSFICDVCGLSLPSKTALFVHNRTHTDVFPFKCSYCEKAYRTRRLLMQHVYRHNEKRYACDVCGRCFLIKSELERHRSIHSDEKPWRCTDCDVSFRLKRYLNKHKRHTHGSPRCLTTAMK